MTGTWLRAPDVSTDALSALREAAAEAAPAPGVAVFALRTPRGHEVFFSPTARRLSQALGLDCAPSGPPADDARLRLLTGDPHVWIDVVRPLV